MAALSKKLTAPLGALETEAKAMEEAVEFAWNMGIRDCVFESDAQIVTNAMLRLTDAPSSIANIVAGAVSHLHKFRSVQLCHVPRTGNKVAHTLAQFPSFPLVYMKVHTSHPKVPVYSIDQT